MKRSKRRVRKQVQVKLKTQKKQEAVAVSWRIANSFVWGKKTFCPGEDVPRLIQNRIKEDLFKKGKLAKVYPDGKVIKFKPPFIMLADDLNIFMANPSLLSPYLNQYQFDAKTLKAIIARGTELGIDKSFLDEVRVVLKGTENGTE